MTPTPGYVSIDKFCQWRLDGDTVECELSSAEGTCAHILFTPLSPSIWRSTFVPSGRTRPLPSPMVVPAADSDLKPVVSDDRTGITIDGSRLSLRVQRRPFCVRFFHEAGIDVCLQNPVDIDGLGRPFVLPLGYGEGLDGTPLAATSFHLAPDEHLFGLGEKFTPLEKTGQRIISWTVDALGSTGERSHKNVPFLWSTRGYGLLLDCTARIRWELGTESTQSYTIVASCPVLDLYVMYGPTPAEILSAFAALTGHAPVPPAWSFGLWVSSGGTYRDRESVEHLVAGLEEHHIDASVVHIDPWWMRWRRYCDFVWDEATFPRHEELIHSLHARSLRLCLWEHPYVSVESELFRIGKERGFFALRPDGEVYAIDYGLSRAPRPDGVVRTADPEHSWNARVAIIDLTNPHAVEWFKDLHRPLLREGVDVFKTDFGEDVPEDAVFSSGETGRTLHNLYPLLYNKAVYDVTAEERGRGIVWSRSGTAGNQRYPVCWSGDPAADFDSLASTIRGGLSAGLSGIPFWSNDIGGYRGKPSEELYIRWAQFGLICSHARMHGDGPREPWAFGRRALDIVRTHIRLRYRLFPYFYSAAHEAARTGLPVLRALPLAVPDDTNVYDKDFEFLVGPMLLAAPVIEPTEVRRIYFPAGAWIDWWTGNVIHGPQTSLLPAPLERLPLFVRGGGIVPMFDEGSSTHDLSNAPLTVHIFPHGSTSYVLYEDGRIRSFCCSAGEEEATLKWTGESTFAVRFHGQSARYQTVVEVDGVPLEENSVRVTDEGAAIVVAVPGSTRGTVLFRR